MGQEPASTFFSHVKPGDTEFKRGGLRDFFLYRDLGIAGATNGKVIDRMLSAPEFAGVKRMPVQGLAVGGLTSGKTDIALQMLPELAANRDVVLAGPVPGTYGAGVDFSAAIATASGDAGQAKALIAFLTAPQAAAIWRANGLEIVAR